MSDRQERIDAAIRACTECEGRDFPKRSDCDGCTAAVDEEIANEARKGRMDIDQAISAITEKFARTDQRDESGNALNAFARAVERDALERAAQVCELHARFCKDEAHGGGDFQHLIARCDEATYNASRIRALMNTPPAPLPEKNDLPSRPDDPLMNLVSRAVIDILTVRDLPGDRQRADDIGRALTASHGDTNWTLSKADSAAFVAAIINPPEPNEVLWAAAERYKERRAESRHHHPKATDPSVALARLFVHAIRQAAPNNYACISPTDLIKSGLARWERFEEKIELTDLGKCAIRIAQEAP